MMKRIGVVGTGFIGTGLTKTLRNRNDIMIGKVLTRRDPATVKGIPLEDLTNSIEDFLENADLIVECSGDVLYGTEVIDRAMKASLPIVTMNSELQITTGSYFAKKGFITEAEGDQPGSLAALRENALEMGFKPVVYGNIKGYLNEEPEMQDMTFWSKKNGISLEMVTSFTDGTKVNIEQVLVANGLGATIAENGLLGPEVKSVFQGGEKLAVEATSRNQPLSDYILCPSAPAGVFITAEHTSDQYDALKYLKMGDGPYYTLLQNHHLCHLEIIKTIRRVFRGEGILLNNSRNPKFSVAAIAKRNLLLGESINKGIGSFEVRGTSIKIEDFPRHIPIGLLSRGKITKSVKKGEYLTFDNVEIPDSLALEAWNQTLHSSINMSGNELINELPIST